MNWVMAHIDEIFQIASGAVAVAAAIAALTPNTSDDGIVGKVRKVVDWLALNVGNAKNAK